MLSQVHPLIWVAFLPLLALIPAVIAYRKGYPFFGAWLISIPFPPLALVTVLLLPAYKVCRYCLEKIKAEASACRHCGRWQAATPDPLTQASPLSQDRPAMDRRGEQRPQLGARATENGFGEEIDDRQIPDDQGRQSARRPTGRPAAVGVGLLATVAVAVLTLPGMRETLWGEAEHSAEAADAAALAPYDPGSVASVAPGKTGLGGAANHLPGRDLDMDNAAAGPIGAARRAVPPLAAPVRGMVPSEERDNTQQPPESPLARVPTLERATGEVMIVPPSFVPPADALRQVQAMLTKLGYDPGPADGIMGPKTEVALRHYESANNLPIGGTFDVLLRPTRAKPVMAAENQSEPTSLLPDIMEKATHF